MIKLKELRVGNQYLPTDGGIRPMEITADDLKAFSSGAVYGKPIDITKGILRDNLGFAIHDMGDFWQCEKEDFVLIQAKFQLAPNKEMPYTLPLKTTVAKSISFKHIHHLQNVYFYIQQKELIWEWK